MSSELDQTIYDAIGLCLPFRFATARDSIFAFPIRNRTSLSSDSTNGRIRAIGSTIFVDFADSG